MAAECDRVVTMAYVGQTPWHGKGFDMTEEYMQEQLAEGKTPTEIWLEVSRLNWKVERRMLAMRPSPNFVVGGDKVMLTDPLSAFRAIVRADTDEVFQIATNRYHPLQNYQIVDFFGEYCAAGNATMETLGQIAGKIWALAKLNGEAEIGKGDKVQGYMMLASSHDGTLGTIGKPTQVRIVCNNTLRAALGGKKSVYEFRLKHSAKWTVKRAAEAKRVMGIAMEQVEQTNAVCRDLSKVTIDEKGREEYVTRLLKGESLLEQVAVNTMGTGSTGLLDAIIDGDNGNTHTDQENGKDGLKRLGKAILEAIIESPGSDLPGARGTLWGAVNGVTYYVDHVRGRNQDSRLNAAWFGAGDGLKTQAVRVAVDMAGLQVQTAGKEGQN